MDSKLSLRLSGNRRHRDVPAPLSFAGLLGPAVLQASVLTVTQKGHLQVQPGHEDQRHPAPW